MVPPPAPSRHWRDTKPTATTMLLQAITGRFVTAATRTNAASRREGAGGGMVTLRRRLLHLALAVGLSVTPQGLGFWPPASSLEPRADVAWAAVPWMISYQGRLTDTGGKVVTGAYTMTFRLYDDATEGAKVWEEEQEVSLAEADGGIFSLVLGGVTSLSTVNFNLRLTLASASRANISTS